MSTPTMDQCRATLGRSKMREQEAEIERLQAELKRARLALIEEQIAHLDADKDAARYRKHRALMVPAMGLTPGQIDGIYDAMEAVCATH